MEIKKIPIADIKPAAYNPRKDLKPTDKEYQKLKKSMGQFDLVEPLIWNKRTGNLVGGHQRLKILRERGDKDVEVSVVDLDDTMEKALNIALNKISGEWDYPALKDLITEIDTGALDIEITGFDESELKGIIDYDPYPATDQDDAVPDVPEEPVTKTGDLYQLGKHRLLCGDSTKREDVERLMDGKKADMVFTDPPYNVAGESNNYAADVSASMQALKNAEWDVGFNPKPFLDVMLEFLADDVSVYVCTSHFLAPDMWEWMKTWATHHSWCVWHKPNPMPSLSKRHWTWDGELIPYATRGKHIFNFPLTGHAPSIWTIPKQKETAHPTEKPVSVSKMAIEHSSNQKQIVLDLFCGSGSTIIACEKTNRICYGMEIDPHYCDVIVKRWEDYTGQKAVRL